jgi:hypothetical protein
MSRLLVVLATIGLSFCLYFYHLGVIPSGLVRDEAALGFNAYTLEKTGADEHGRILPFNMESFGDWKLPGYSYLSIPLISAFGLTSFSVRLLSAIAGILGILGIYLLVKTFYPKKTALVSSLIFSIVPWHLHFSRAAYEANVALTFFIFGLYFFERRKNIYGIFLSGLLFLMTLMTYHSAHVFLPLFWLFLTFLDRKIILRKLPMVIGTTVVSLVLFSFVAISLFGNETKISGIGIFSDQLAIHLNVEVPRNNWGNTSLSKIIFNRPVYLSSTIVKNFLSFFSPSFLVSQGGINPQHNLPGSGNLTWAIYVLMLVGLALSLFRLKTRPTQLVLAIILFGLIPSSITRDAPHYTRSIFTLPAIVILTSVGLIYLSKKHWFLGLVLGIALFTESYFFSQRYFLTFPQTGGKTWNKDFVSAMQIAISKESQYDNIIIPRPDYSPYIFLAFYKPWDPTTYQTQVTYYQPTAEGFRHVKALGKYKFPSTISSFPFQLGEKYLIIDWRDREERYPGTEIPFSKIARNESFRFFER